MVAMSRWLLLVLLAVVVSAEDNSDVLEFDSDSFQDGIAGKDIILVEFYAPWSVNSGLLVSRPRFIYRQDLIL